MKLSAKSFIQTSSFGLCAMACNLLMPPENVRGMKILDREQFRKTVNVPVLKVPTNKIKAILPHLKSLLLKMEHLPPLRVSRNENMRDVLLRPDLVNSWDHLPQQPLINCDINERSFNYEPLHLSYENWGAKDIFKSVLPTEEEGLSSFSIIGHVVHVNLRFHLLPYKQLIGEVLVDKIPNCRTVVNKTSTIESVYRNFDFEILAGVPSYVVDTKENGYVFRFDFSQVYWNPRLSSEHERVYKILNKNDTVYDVFAGVGPFVVPAACKGCRVFANDINPESIRWLRTNISLNHANAELVQAYNMDGREFIKTIVKPDLLSRLREKSMNNIYLLMNLPALAVEFLDVFRGLLAADVQHINFDEPGFRCPLIYCYTFVKGNDADSLVEIKNNISLSMGMSMEEDLMEIKFVRNVAPNKNMFRALIRLGKKVLTTARTDMPLSTTFERDDSKSDGLLKRGFVSCETDTHSNPKKICGI